MAAKPGPMATNPVPAPMRRVRVWFGEIPIADYSADLAKAVEYADAMKRRFAGLRVTNEPLSEATEFRPLPSERSWDVIPPH